MSLAAALRALVGHRLLVAMDFDGTLADIVEHPEDARPVEGAVEALARLASFDEVEVSVVSGRRLVDLRRFLGPPPGVALVGEHGAAWEGIEVAVPDGFEETRSGLEDLARRFSGAWVEAKSASIVVHTRQVDPAAEQLLVDTITEFLEGRALAHDLGKKVIDVAFVDTSKGAAVRRLRQQTGAERVLFAGDDTTDESVFVDLEPGDVGIRVGHEPTAAHHRVGGPAEVVGVLRRLAVMLQGG